MYSLKIMGADAFGKTNGASVKLGGFSPEHSICAVLKTWSKASEPNEEKFIKIGNASCKMSLRHGKGAAPKVFEAKKHRWKTM